jgi:hypothetical protein
MDKVAFVISITHPMDNNDEICEVQCISGRKYQFKTNKIDVRVENVKFKKFKTAHMRKAKKWWDEQSNRLKILKTYIVIDVMNLASKDLNQLDQFI